MAPLVPALQLGLVRLALRKLARSRFVAGVTSGQPNLIRTNPSFLVPFVPLMPLAPSNPFWPLALWSLRSGFALFQGPVKLLEVTVAGVTSGQPNLIRTQSVSPICTICAVRSVDAIGTIQSFGHWPCGPCAPACLFPGAPIKRLKSAWCGVTSGQPNLIHSQSVAPSPSVPFVC